jgi:hypothetical protein
MRRFFVRALLCLSAGFAVVIVGMLVHEHFYWAQLRADLAVFFDTIASGDAGQIIEALMTAPGLMVYLAACLGVGIALDSWRQRRRKRRMK